ncbi:hypothetical protein ALC60_00431, partial [Trachymyrmex zeteki]
DAAEQARVRELPTSTVRGNCRRSVCDGGFPTRVSRHSLRSPARNRSRSHDDTRAIHPLPDRRTTGDERKTEKGENLARGISDHSGFAAPHDLDYLLISNYLKAIIHAHSRQLSHCDDSVNNYTSRDVNPMQGKPHDTLAWRNRHGRLKVVDFNERKVN